MKYRLCLVAILLAASFAVHAKKLEVTVNVDQSGIENCNTAVASSFTGLQIKIFPNPNNGIFNIQFDDNTESALFNVKIINSMGQVIRELEISVENKNIPVDLSGNTGMYFVLITSGEAYYLSKIVVK